MRTPRFPVIAQSCALVVIAALTTQAAAATAGYAPLHATEISTTETRLSATVRIASYNTHARLSASAAAADVMKLAGTGADILALQEMGSKARRNAVTSSLVDCSMCAYEAYMPESAVPGSTPILFKWEKFRLESTGTRQVSEATYVGRKGAGPSTLRAKYINYVELRERTTGNTVYVLNNHAVPTVQARDGGRNQNHERLALYRKHMTGLKALVTELKATGATVFVTGDLNVNYRKDRVVRDRLFPYYNLGQVGAQASYQSVGEPNRGTHVLSSGHDTRLIDYVYFLRHPAVTPVANSVLLGYASDHRPVLADFVLSSRG